MRCWLGSSSPPHLILAGRPALDLLPVVVHVVVLPHPVEHVVHAGEVGPDAHVVVLHRVLAPHRVETWRKKEEMILKKGDLLEVQSNLVMSDICPYTHVQSNLTNVAMSVCLQYGMDGYMV